MSALVVTPYAVTSGYVVALIIFVVFVVAVLGTVRVLDRRRNLGAARFDLTLEVEGADADGVVVANPAVPTTKLYVHVGMTNVGPRAAGRTVLYVLVPRGIDARWIRAQKAYEPELTAERLHVGEREVEAWYLQGVLPQVNRGDHPVATLTLEAPIPAEVPIRFRAAANELAADDPAVIERLFLVRDS